MQQPHFKEHGLSASRENMRARFLKFALPARRRLSHCILVAAIVLMCGSARGQSTVESSAPAADLAPAAIPFADLVTEAESVSARYRDIRADLSADQSAETVAQRVPVIAREIDGRLRESRRIVAQSPSIETLRGLEGEWNRLRRELAALNKDLTGRLHEL